MLARLFRRCRQVIDVQRDEKAVLSALLAKFPGLTLEHLAVRHRAATPPAGVGQDPGRSDDEATIELIHYTRPASP